MKTFNSFIKENDSKPDALLSMHRRLEYEMMFESQGYGEAPGKQMILKEAAIMVGGSPPPKFGNVIILAGGAGSGKGTVLSNLILVDGKTFDPDKLKSIAMKLPNFHTHLQKHLPADYDANEVLGRRNPLADPVVVGAMHSCIKELGWDTTVQDLVFRRYADLDRLPNLIFDTTLAKPGKLQDICRSCIAVGYQSKNIHLVWVVQPLTIALKQNASRARKVPENTLKGTHVGAAQRMSELIKDSQSISGLLDGEIYIMFNDGRVDMKWERPYNGELGPFYSDKPMKNKNGSPVVDDYGNVVYPKQRNTIKQLTTRPVRLKDRGRPLDSARMSNEIIAKICQYVPNGAFDVA